MVYLFLVIFMWVKLGVTGRIHVSIFDLIITETEFYLLETNNNITGLTGIDTCSVTCLWCYLCGLQLTCHLYLSCVFVSVGPSDLFYCDFSSRSNKTEPDWPSTCLVTAERDAVSDQFSSAYMT